MNCALSQVVGGLQLAQLRLGDYVVIQGAGGLGVYATAVAKELGAGKVIVIDGITERLDLARAFGADDTIDFRELKDEESRIKRVMDLTDGWGADVVFEASGSPKAWDGMLRSVRPGGALVLVGLPPGPVPFDVNAAIAKELRIETVFRYANVFDRALALIAAGKVDLKPLVSGTYPFADAVAAFERAAEGRPADVKLQIVVDEAAAAG